MRRHIIALPGALLLSIAVVGTASASFCGNESKQDGAGQKAVIVVDFSTNPPTEIVWSGANAAGKVPGGFVDVYLDFDGNKMPSAGDCFIDDTFILSSHGGLVAPGQDEDGLVVNPAVHHGANPGGSNGVGFAELSAGCFG